MIDIPIVTTFIGTGVSQAQKGLGALTSSAAKALGAVATLTAAFSLAKSSLHAFAEEQNQQAIMLNTLKNQGWGALSDTVERTIQQMRLATGVSAEELRPAFDKLFLATGDASKSLDVLNVALDVAKGTGKDLATVSQALAKGFLGNTTSLTRLGAGLDKATLATGNMDIILGSLQSKLGGSAATSAQTLAGQISILGQNVEVAKESIGSHLVDAMGKASGKDGISGMTDAVNGLADALNRLIDVGGTLSGWFNKLNKPFSEWVDKIDTFIFGKNFMDSMDRVLSGASKNPKKTGIVGPHDGSLAIQSVLAGKVAHPVVKAKTPEELKAEQQLKAKIALDKAHLAIMTLGNKFDMKRIELQAVIDGTATESQKASAKAQLALLDAQDKMTLNTLAGSNAALQLANSGLAELVIKDKLATKEAALIQSAQDLADGFGASAASVRQLIADNEAFAGTSLAGLANLNAMQDRNSWVNGASTPKKGAGGGNAPGMTGGISVVIQTPAVITPTTVEPIVQAATDALARNGYTSSRAAGTNGWQ